MPNARTVQLSLDHLVAEMIAFPFVSRTSLGHPLESLDGRMSPATATLWRHAEQYFVSHFPHTSIDELIAVRNDAWFGASDSDLPLHDYLRHSAGNWLRRSGAVAEPTLPNGTNHSENDDAAARRAWRWLTFAMPGDLLLAGLAKGGHGPVRCNLITPFVARMLREKGFAETHLHLGAGLDFPTAWASAVNVVARSPNQRPGMAWNAFSSPGADHNEGRALANWLVRSAIVRYLLGAFLKWGHQTGGLREFLDNGDIWQPTGLSLSDRAQIQLAVQDLNRGTLMLPETPTPQHQLEQSFIALQSACNTLTRASTIPLPRNLDDVQQLDPLSRLFPPETYDRPTVQIRFLWRGLDYLDRSPDDRLFARLFWQVERVRCQVYRHCIQRPLTPGLMNFIRVYDRKGAVTGVLEDIELESCGVLGGVGRGLQSLEFRTRPARNPTGQLAALRRWQNQLKKLRQRPEWKEVECGVALHFLKFRGTPADRGIPQANDRENNADPELMANTMWYRWQMFRMEVQTRANALADAIERDPSQLRFLRAIDVCRDEHGVPTWVIAPVFRRVRERVNQAIADAYAQTGTEYPQLRTTVHVGEDFVHLATGLRYMDEAVTHIPLRAGDRAGHGLALGIHPQDWAGDQHRQLLPREDHWLDLIWERTWHCCHESRFNSARRTWVDDQIVRLGRDIFGSRITWTPELAMQFYTAQHDESPDKLGFPDQMLAVPDSPETTLNGLLRRYLMSPAVYRRCREVIWVESHQDGDAVAELQRLVRRRYAQTGITIEVNPVSNLMVGDLTDFTSHPLWRLAPGLENQEGEPLRVCIGSDDPLPFATNLPEEYQFLYDALLLAGKSHAAARAWLDEIRDTGMESRFTVPLVSTDPDSSIADPIAIPGRG